MTTDELQLLVDFLIAGLALGVVMRGLGFLIEVLRGGE
jgi:hypothetical protein